MLSDVYAPTVDATNVETMQYLVTDGSSFTDLQTRDMTYTATGDASGMLCTVTSTAKSNAYQLVTTYLTDPARDSVVVHTRYVPLTAAARSYQLYVRLDANAGGNGGGGAPNGGADSAVVDTSTGSQVPVSFDTNTTSQADRAYAVPSYLALRADRPFTAVSSGFVGEPSDGLTQLDANHALGPITTTATNGNVEQTAGISLGNDRSTTLALGFGTTQPAAVQTATATESTSLASLVASYQRGWAKYDAGLRRPHLAGSGLSAGEAADGNQRLLPVGQRREGVGGQDVPGRDHRRAGRAVGAVDRGERPEQPVLDRLPRGVLPRPLRGVDGAVHRRRPEDRAGHRPLPAARQPAGGRVRAPQLAARRHQGAGRVQHPARRVVVPAADGPAVRARPAARSCGRTSSGWRTS